MVWLLGTVLRGTQAACSPGDCAVLGPTTPAPESSLLIEALIVHAATFVSMEPSCAG